MTQPKAKFIEESYSKEELYQKGLEFLEKGYTFLSNVFEGESVKEFKLQLEDALLIDQHAWCKGISRIASDTRFVFVYGIYALPHHYVNKFQLHSIQMKHWMNTKSLKDRIYFEEPFAPPAQKTINVFKEEFNNSGY